MIGFQKTWTRQESDKETKNTLHDILLIHFTRTTLAPEHVTIIITQQSTSHIYLKLRTTSVEKETSRATKNINSLEDICTLQLETAIMFEILDKPKGSCPANMGLAGCADIVTLTFFTQGSATTTSFALFSNYKRIVFCHIIIQTKLTRIY